MPEIPYASIGRETGHSGQQQTPTELGAIVPRAQAGLAAGVYNVAEAEDKQIQKEQEKKQSAFEATQAVDIVSGIDNELENYTGIAKQRVGKNALDIGDKLGVRKQAEIDYKKMVEDSMQRPDIQKLSPEMQLHIKRSLTNASQVRIRELGTWQDTQQVMYVNSVITAAENRAEVNVAKGADPEKEARTVAALYPELYKDQPNQDFSEQEKNLVSRLQQIHKVKQEDVLIGGIETLLKTSDEFVKPDGSVDYDKAINTLLTVKFQQEHDINPQQKDRIFNDLKAEQAYQLTREGQIRVKAVDDEQNKLLGIYRKNPQQALKDIVKSTVLSEEEKYRMEKELIKTKAMKSDRGTVLRGVELMYDSSVDVAVKKQWILNNSSRLDDGDYDRLSNLAFSREERSNRAAEKAGIALIKTSLNYSGIGSTGQERIYQAIKMYQDSVKANKDDLKSYEQVRDHAASILARPEFSNINQIDDMKSDIKVGVSKMPTQNTPQKATRMIYRNGKLVKE